jgi:hypothetical protein
MGCTKKQLEALSASYTDDDAMTPCTGCADQNAAAADSMAARQNQLVFKHMQALKRKRGW